jgi:Tol biopolymer transport system component
MKRVFLVLIVTAAALVAVNATPTADDPLRLPQEKHLRNIRQLTFGGENAEAYFSGDGKKLIFQSTPELAIRSTR